MSKNKTNKKKYKYQKVIGWKPLPPINGICKDCKRFEHGTACNRSAFWCYKKGYLQESFVQNAKKCPDFDKKEVFVSVYGAGADRFNFDDADFLGGLY